MLRSVVWQILMAQNCKRFGRVVRFTQAKLLEPFLGWVLLYVYLFNSPEFFVVILKRTNVLLFHALSRY